MFPPLKNKNDLLFSITMSSPTDHKRRAQPAKSGYIHDSKYKYLNNNQKINERFSQTKGLFLSSPQLTGGQVLNFS